MNLDYDRLPDRAQATLEYPIDAPLDLAARSVLAGRRVRRRRRVLTGVGSLAVVAVVAIVVPALVPSHGSSMTRVAGLAPASQSASAAAAAAASKAAADASAAELAAEAAREAAAAEARSSAAASPNPGATEPAPVVELPAHFLAAIGAEGRESVVITTTGGQGRLLTPSSQTLNVVSDDGTTLWEPVGGGTEWQAINVATGAVSAAPQFSGDSQFAIAPDGTIAAVKGQSLQVGARTLPFVEDPYPQWSADSRHLVIEAKPGIEVLDSSLNVTEKLTAPSGCTLAQPHFRGDQTLVVAENCAAAGTASLVIFDLGSGQQLARVPVVTAAQNLLGITSLDVDSVGAVIAAVSYTSGTSGVVYTVTADGVVSRQGTTDAFQVNWLPRTAQ